MIETEFAQDLSDSSLKPYSLQIVLSFNVSLCWISIKSLQNFVWLIELLGLGVLFLSLRVEQRHLVACYRARGIDFW